MRVSREWAFRTATGRATVADGLLRVSTSVRRTLREKWREGWTRNDAGRRVLFVASVLGPLAFLAEGVSGARAVLTGTADGGSVVVLAAIALVAVALAYRLTRMRSVHLWTVETVRRVDDDRLRVEYAEECKHFEVETPAGADEAVEMLWLRGVPVEDATDSGARLTRGFRERLLAKAATD